MNRLLLFLCLFPLSLPAQPAYIHHENGVAKLKAGQHAAAILDFDKAIKADATYFEAYIDRGRAQQALGKNDLALADFNKGVQLNQKFAPGFLYRAQYYEAIKQDKLAIDDYTKIIQLRADYAEAYVARGLLYSKGGQNDLAMADYNKAIALNAKNAEVFYQRGLLHWEMKKTNEAMKDLSDAIAADPLMVKAYFERGKLYAAQSRQHELAVNDFSKAITLKFPGEEIYKRRAASLTLLKRNDEAWKDYSVMIEQLRTRDGEVYKLRGDIFAARKDHANAIKDYNKALTFKKDDPATLIARGKSQLALGKGKYPMAQQDFNKALELDPNNAEAAAGLGEVHFGNGKYEEGIEALSKSIKLKPAADAYYLRSKCHHMLKNKKNVCEDLKKAAELGHPEAKKDVTTMCAQ